MNVELLKDQIVIAYGVSLLLEWLKRLKSLPWINAHTDKLNRNLSKLIAVATSAGIALAWSGSADAGWTVTLSIPSAHSLWDFAVNAAFSFFAQEVAYKTSIKEKA